MTKIDIVSGFLGAGKTTFIKKMLEEAFAGEQVVLIENEFGEIGIDGGFLKDAGIEIREMNSGCICCSLVGDFGKSLKEVVDTYHPDRILIEPSGVGKLSDVIKAVQDVQDTADVQLNSFITVVDVLKCRLYLNNFGEFFSNQVEHAGAIVLSRTDKTSSDKVEACVDMLRKLNVNAPIITTPIKKLTGAKLLETMEHGQKLEEILLEETACPTCGGHHHHGHACGCGHDHGHHHEEHTCDHDHHHDHTCGHHHHHHGENHHHADEVFASWGKETIRAFSKEEIAYILESLESDASIGTVLRAKGMVEGADGEWIYFDMVPGERDVRGGSPDYTGRVCVIGAGLDSTKLAELFKLQEGKE